MAANLDQDLETGVGTVFSVRESMWHRDGHVLTEAPSLKKALKLAGHNFEVDLLEMHFSKPLRRRARDGQWYGDSVDVKLPDHRAVVRTDRWAPLGVVGNEYHVVQNAEAFAILEPLLDAGLVQLETGGTLRGGRDVWMQVRLNIDHPVVQQVEAELGARPLVFVYNNHTGSRKLTIKEAWERIVCANTLEIAFGQGGRRESVRHTTGAKVRLVDAAQRMFANLTDRHVTAAQQFQVLRGRYLDEQMFERLVLDVVAPLPKVVASAKELTPRQVGALQRIETRRARLVELRSAGDGHTGDGSAWECYNALTQSLDHDVELWRVRGGERTAAASFGRLAQMKVLVLKNLLTPTWRQIPIVY